MYVEKNPYNRFSHFSKACCITLQKSRQKYWRKWHPIISSFFRLYNVFYFPSINCGVHMKAAFSLFFFVRILCFSFLGGSPLLSAFSDAIEDQIPMLFMVADYGDEAFVLQENAGKSLREVTEHIDRLVSEKKIGGVLFKGRWTPTGLKERISHLQALSSIPLIFAQDLEWGLAMRHDGVIQLPKALCVSAISNDALLKAWAHAIASTAKEIGINLFLGPVADVNTNPKNPIIHDRSFGDNPQEVARKVCIIIRTFQEHGIATCVKHFPGHGNTAKDSHTDLPVIASTLSQLKEVELVPFKAAVECGVDCVMSAHICLPNTTSGDAPATLSPFWCKQILRNELKFGDSGVLITDDLIMGGVLKSRTCAEAAAAAVMAGNDLCIISHHFEDCFHAILHALKAKKISREEIETHVRRVADLQCRCHRPFIENDRFSAAQIVQLSDLLYLHALTSIGTPYSFSPESTHILQIGSVPLSPLLHKLVLAYPSASISMMGRNPRQEEIEGFFRELGQKKEVLVVLCDLERSPSLTFGLTPALLQGLQRIQDHGCQIRYTIFGSPYIVPLLPQPVRSALIAYEKTSGSEQAVLQALSGKFKPIGTLPVKLDIIE
jgi:beta-N-acetylhexosaminidase